MEIIAIAISSSTGLLATLLTGWYAKRVHVLEESVDKLDRELQAEWLYTRKLQDHIYRNGLTPPGRE